jgi:putative membrane protein
MAPSRPSIQTRRRSTYPMYHTTQRKPRRWPLVLRVTKGSVHLHILPTVLFHCLFTALIVYLDLYVHPVGLPGSIVPSLSIVVGLMLVFRNGSSYDRFWSGRNQLTAVITSVRNLTRYFLVSGRDANGNSSDREDADTEAIVRVLIATLYAVKHNLRSEFSSASDLTRPGSPITATRSGLNTPNLFSRSGTQTPKPFPSQSEPLSESFSTLRPEYSDLLPPTHLTLEDQGLSMPLQLSVSVESYIRRGVIRGWWAPPQASYISTQLANLISSYGTMETIRHTPIPVAHLIHARQVLALYLMVLPFAMVQEMTWWAIPVVALVAFTLYGIEGIGSQLEDPFGYDKNDIKMDAIIEDARMECDALLVEWKSNKESPLFYFS